ncbi:hypothetical protein Tco_0847550 [Tanacetum coccineum]
MVLSDSESEDAANSSKQGRNLGEEDVFETSKGKDSGEADISPSGLNWKFGFSYWIDRNVIESLHIEKFKSSSEEMSSGFNKYKFWWKSKIREEKASLAKIARIPQAQEARNRLKWKEKAVQQRKRDAEVQPTSPILYRRRLGI